MSIKDGQWEKAMFKDAKLERCKLAGHDIRTTEEGEWCETCEQPLILDLVWFAKWAVAILVVSALGLWLSTTPVHCAEINMAAIAQIESSGRVNALGDNGHAYGLYQLTAPVIREYGRYSVDEVRSSPKLQTEVARWYLHVRIPQMIRAYGKPVTAANQLVAYNAGIKYVKTGKPLPKITRDYLRKYADLTGGAL